MNLLWYNIITQILQFTLGFILGVVYSMGLDKDMVTYIIVSYKACSLPRNPLCSDCPSPYHSNHRLLISIPLSFPAGHMLSCYHWVWLFGTLWTVDCQAPLSMEFSRQEYWNGLPCSSPRNLPNPETKLTSPVSPASPAWKAEFLPLSHWRSHVCIDIYKCSM